MCDRRSGMAASARWLVAVWSSWQATAALAGLETIHEGGPTIHIDAPLAPFVDPKASPQSAARPPSIAGTTLPVSFPVQTASMRPGRLRAPMRLRAPISLPRPMFIVGDDAASRQWLAANRQRLARIGANGVATNVSDLDTLRTLQRMAPGVPLTAASLDSLAAGLGLTVYPVLIRADGQVTQEVQ